MSAVERKRRLQQRVGNLPLLKTRPSSPAPIRRGLTAVSRGNQGPRDPSATPEWLSEHFHNVKKAWLGETSPCWCWCCTVTYFERPVRECSHSLRPRLHGPGSSVPPAFPTEWSKFSPTLYTSQDSEGLVETTSQHTMTRNVYDKGWQTCNVTMETNPQSAVRLEAACSSLEDPSRSRVR